MRGRKREREQEGERERNLTCTRNSKDEIEMIAVDASQSKDKMKIPKTPERMASLSFLGGRGEWGVRERRFQEVEKRKAEPDEDNEARIVYKVGTKMNSANRYERLHMVEFMKLAHNDLSTIQPLQYLFNLRSVVPPSNLCLALVLVLSPVRVATFTRACHMSAMHGWCIAAPPKFQIRYAAPWRPEVCTPD